MTARGPHPQSSRVTVLSLGLCALVVMAVANADPDPFRLNYRLTSNGSEIAEVVQTLDATEKGRWRFRSQVIPAGMLTSLVSGRIEEITELEHLDGRLRPRSYRYQRRGLARDRDVSVRFDWDRLRAYNEVNGDRWSMAIPDDALDKHSLVLAVSADLHGVAV